MENKFLAIDKRYFGTGLRSLDLLIVAHIEELQRNGCECHFTNQQFCEMFGEDINAVKRSIKKLEDMGVITRCTTFIKDNGRGNRQRRLNINHQWKAQCEPTITEWMAHNEPSISPEEKDGVSVAEIAGSPAKKTFVSGDGLPGRRIRDLSDAEAQEIKKKLSQGIRYLDIENEYGMRRGQIDAKFQERWRAFIVAKSNGRV